MSPFQQQFGKPIFDTYSFRQMEHKRTKPRTALGVGYANLPCRYVQPIRWMMWFGWTSKEKGIERTFGWLQAPATNSINHLAGFSTFHLGQIRVTSAVYRTEVVIDGQTAQRSFSGLQPSSSARCLTNLTKRRCSSRFASICGAP
jgi:hypothetical protein